MRLIARILLAWQLKHKVVIRFHRISTHANTIADKLSRFKSPPKPGSGEQRLSPATFHKLQVDTGLTFTVDACANASNSQLPRFVAREDVTDSRCIAVDVFTYIFPGATEVIYCFPPWILLAPVWAHFRQQRCVGTLVFPRQPTKPWFGIVSREARRIGVLARQGDTSALLAAPEYTLSAGPLPWDLCFAVFDFRVPVGMPRL